MIALLILLLMVVLLMFIVLMIEGVMALIASLPFIIICAVIVGLFKLIF